MVIVRGWRQMLSNFLRSFQDPAGLLRHAVISRTPREEGVQLCCRMISVIRTMTATGAAGALDEKGQTHRLAVRVFG